MKIKKAAVGCYFLLPYADANCNLLQNLCLSHQTRKNLAKYDNLRPADKQGEQKIKLYKRYFGLEKSDEISDQDLRLAAS